MKILLAGPGTGKTSKVKDLIKENYETAKNILILSFTNATVNDLTQSFSGNPNVRCYTLHSFALVINHMRNVHVLDDLYETPILQHFSDKYEIEFEKLCYFFQCITFDNMIKSCLEFLQANPVYGKEKVGELDLLIVDEFQDFNSTERDLIYQLSNNAKETIILGDDDQSIYEFKDADPLGIIELFNNKTVEKIAHENKCFRCPDVVVEHSKRLIRKNINRIDKPWETTGKEGNISFHQFLTQQDAIQFILNETKGLRAKDKEKTGSILVLSPVRYHVEELVEVLESEKIDFVDFWTSRVNIDDIKKIWWLKAILGGKGFLELKTGQIKVY